MKATILFLILTNAAAATTIAGGRIEIKAGKLCIHNPGGSSTCLYKDEWNDRLKAMQELMRQYDSQLKSSKEPQ